MYYWIYTEAFIVNFMTPINKIYYKVCLASAQDESNTALWLAACAGKVELSCPLGTTRRVPHKSFPRKPYNKSFLDQACSDKMAGCWPCSLFACLWTSTPSINIQKQLGQYPAAILTSHLVNNPYVADAKRGKTCTHDHEWFGFTSDWTKSGASSLS